jgi:hypothetical protein
MNLRNAARCNNEVSRDVSLLPLWTFVVCCRVNFVMFLLDSIDSIASSGVSMGEK